jgi:pimeloyl-ACP methyl ester carboxylesterase
MTNLPKNFEQTFTHKTVNLDGVNLHYVIGGQGKPIVLLHGWPQTWYAWRKILPTLAQHHTVIALDLPGLGESSVPTKGYDKRSIAQVIHQLITHLGFDRINLVGHDIGGMVAYAYAATHPETVQRLVLAEFWLPGFGLEDGMDIAKGGSWHFGFHMAPEIPEMLTAGREREYLSMLIYRTGIEATAIDEYVRHYAAPGGMHNGFEYYRTLLKDGQQNRELAKNKLRMPVLVLTGSDSPIGEERLLKGVQSVSVNVQSHIIEGSVHWLAEEQPESLSHQLLTFFAA